LGVIAAVVVVVAAVVVIVVGVVESRQNVSLKTFENNGFGRRQSSHEQEERFTSI
jgi:hypothetical protein